MKKILKMMKQYMVILPLSSVTVLVSLPQGADAQFVVGSVISSTVGRVIRAIDLEVQRLQNQTIWLQDAQKALENQLSKLKLTEISGVSQQQQELFEHYYTDLATVKTVIADYERIREFSRAQAALLSQYEQAWALLKADRHFSAAELATMQQVYSGILQESVKNLDELLVVVNSFKTQMSDAKRLELINQAGARVERNLGDLKAFNNQNFLLSLQRAKDENEVLTLKRYYGLDQ